MFEVIKPKTPWSRIGIWALIGSIIVGVILSLLDGYFRGPFLETHLEHHGDAVMLATWVTDMRYLAEQIIFAGAFFAVGAKFIETRTIFSIGFDKLDADKVSCKGPDENNVVWVGRRYGTRMEAEAVAQVFESRLKESAGG